MKDLELEKITDPSKIPQVIHGTYLNHWENISKYYFLKFWSVNDKKELYI